MKFRTEIEIPTSELTLSPEEPILMVGSCFAYNMGKRMRECLWDADNSSGVLYNPLSIAEWLRMALLSEHPAEAFATTLFEGGGMIHSWMGDTTYSATGVEECVDRFRRIAKRIRNVAEQGKTICITFGTAYCYFLNGMNMVVANCHKQPAALFTRRRIEIEEITMPWLELIARLKERYPGLRLIFTVSPVRHIRDGLSENTLSKATLRLAVERLCREEGCYYFPAYEIMLDDLRDYRFYAGDLVHPNEQGVEYIWERFVETYLDEAGKCYLKEGNALMKRVNHRHINATAEMMERFAAQTQAQLRAFKALHPGALLPHPNDKS